MRILGGTEHPLFPKHVWISGRLLKSKRPHKHPDRNAIELRGYLPEQPSYADQSARVTFVTLFPYSYTTPFYPPLTPSSISYK
jgi:hypothetical protein